VALTRLLGNVMTYIMLGERTKAMTYPRGSAAGNDAEGRIQPDFERVE